MYLTDDDGTTIDVNGKMFILWCRETYEMALALAIEHNYARLGIHLSQRQIVRFVNQSLEVTWKSDPWLRNYMHFMYKRLREMQEKGT